MTARDESRRAMERFLRSEVVAFSPLLAEADVEPRTTFLELGFDSLMAVDFKDRLEAALGRPLRSSLLFDFPTTEALAAHLVAEEPREPGGARDAGPSAAADSDGDAGDLEALSEDELRAALARTRARLRATLEARDEPIAVVGMACRFPGGANDPDAFWHLLADGVDAITEVPPERWSLDELYDPDPAAPGRMYTRGGGFIGAIDGFDAPFFGLAPREARELDPQQRLLLEVTWEALEHAGQSPAELFGTRTGVFIGTCGSEYFDSQTARAPEEASAYHATGNRSSTAAGRIAYTLGLRGPNLPVDTACSSSLVALHLACESLRRGESSAALAGGVSLLLDPLTTIGVCRANMLAPDGRCKSFAAEADGYVRSEGCGMVMLKRLSKARADGDRVLALVRGTAINQDGASSGLTVPNGPAQEAVIADALARCGVDAADVGYVEAHGTGTALGDPIEMRALDAVYGRARPAGDPLLVASVKTNVGHLEPAAGIAGVIKAVLCLEHEEIPPHLHFANPSPHIPWDELNVSVPTARTRWPRGPRPRMAGVSAFGFSGTNAHAILEEAPAAHVQQALAPAAGEQRAELVPLSAATPDALAELARRYADAARSRAPEAPVADVAFTAGAGRSHLRHRAAVVAATCAELAAALEPLASGEPASAAVRRGAAPPHPPTVGFLFTGQGSQFAGMGRELLDRSPVFTREIDRCAAVLDRLLGTPLRALLCDADASVLDETRVTQPVLCAFGWALARTLVDAGIRPAAVLGHSVGEYAAAALAGVLALEDALRLAAARGRLMAERCERGDMRVVFAERARVDGILATHAGRASVAAENGPEVVVVSGAPDALRAIDAELARAGVRTVELPVSHAFHSPLVEPMQEPFAALVRDVELREPELAFVSCLDAASSPRAAEYWVRHVREPVRFHDGVQRLLATGCDLLVEIGPRPALAAMAKRFLPPSVSLVPAHREGGGDRRAWLGVLGELYVRGVAPDWRRLTADVPRRKVPLPLYPFQRVPTWFEGGPGARVARAGGAAAARRGAHVLLGARSDSPLVDDASWFEARLSERSPAWLAGHRVWGTAVLPAAAHLELMLAAAADRLGGGTVVLENASVEAPLFLAEERRVQTSVRARDDGSLELRVDSRAADGDGWTRHARARARAGDPGETVGLADALARCTEPSAADALYATFDGTGLEYGAAFRAVRSLARGTGEVVARLALPPEARGGADGFRVHPILVDAAFQCAAAVLDAAGIDGTWLPVGADRVVSRADPADAGNLACHVRLSRDPSGDGDVPAARRAADRRVVAVDVALFEAAAEDDAAGDDAAGDAVLTVERLALVRATPSALAGEHPADRLLYRVAWRRVPVVEPAAQALANRAVVLVGGGGPVGDALGAALEARGALPLFHEVPVDGEAALERAVAEHAPVAVVCLAALAPRGEPGDWRAVQEACLGSLFATVRALARAAAGGARPRLLVATRGARATGDAVRPVDPDAATLWGLAASAALEHREVVLACVDLDPLEEEAAADARHLVTELAALAADGAPREDRVARRGDERLAARLVPERGRPRLRMPAGTGAPWALRSREVGQLEHLELVEAPLAEPGPGEVAIDVEASGVNFKDVLYALGMLEEPGRAAGVASAAAPPLGFECAGTVAALGAGVTDLAVGDAVYATVPAGGAHASRVACDARLVARRPVGLPVAVAAGCPTVFATALYALERLAAIGPGDRVLVHAAAGGVGAAAIAVARRAGAEVFATAGRGKHAAVRRLGARRVYDSRSLDFAGAVLRDTDGRGVDVVLNSLSGAAVDASFACLAEGGRFVELGKLGTWSPERARAERPDVRYHAFDLADVLRETPALGGELLQELTGALEDGSLARPPTTAFDRTRARDAFARLAQAQAVGKVVLTGERAREAPVRAGRTYLVTGGLGALGLLVARWLVERGATRLLLLSRRGPEAAGEAARGAARELAEHGAEVRVEACDVADEADVRRVLAEVPADAPLAGVVHAAGVLDDGMLAGLAWERVPPVLAPKLAGAWNLHRATLRAPLDFFALFSSMASVVGSAGQASYSAANAGLDALAELRHSLGLPATSLGFGPWSGGGMAARVAEAGRARFRELGLSTIAPEEGIAVLARALAGDAAHAGVLPVDWTRFVAAFRGSAPGFYAELAARTASGQPPDTGDRAARDLVAELRAAPDTERPPRVRAWLAGELAQVLGFASPDELDPGREFVEMGVDSLLAVELRNRLEADLGVALPATLLFDHPTLGDLAAALLGTLSGATPADTGVGGAARRGADGDDDLLRQVESLSEEDAERLLASLGGGEPRAGDA